MKTNSSSGFGLVETLLVLTMFGVAGMLLMSVLVQNNNIASTQSVKVSQGLSLNDSISQVNSLIRSSAFIALGYPVDSPEYSSDQETLVLGLPSLDLNDQVIPNVYDYAVFTKDSSNPEHFKKMVFPNAISSRRSENTTLIYALSLIKFDYIDSAGSATSPNLAAKVKFIINVSEKAGVEEEESSRSGEVNLRND